MADIVSRTYADCVDADAIFKLSLARSVPIVINDTPCPLLDDEGRKAYVSQYLPMYLTTRFASVIVPTDCSSSITLEEWSVAYQKASPRRRHFCLDNIQA